MRIDRRALFHTRWDALVRLAEFHGLKVGPGPETVRRRYDIVEALVRKLDAVPSAEPEE